MKRIINSLIAAACLLPALGLAASVTLNPVADATVQDGNKADVNFGSTPELRVQSNATASNNYDSYLRFDTGTGQIVSARLRLYAALSAFSGSGSLPVSTYGVSDTTWSESAITWNTRPALGGSLGSITISTDYAWQEIDVSAYVQSERAAGRSVISLGLHNELPSSVYAKANSREGANPPQLVVVTNDAPTVSLTAPATGSSYTAPASVTLAASAADGDGSIATVEFYNGATLIGAGTLAGGSYTLDWTSVAAGSYSLTAKATDNLGATTTSAPVTVNVDAAITSSVYYIHADHLNTPRVITDASNKVVWRWDSDPFGASTANEDPDGDGATFTYNLRFPGQYYDKETGLHYNYFRDYDPSTGRYVQSDPIGLAGGINTYAYVEGDPILGIDPLGLAAEGVLPGFGSGAGTGAGAGLGEILGALGTCARSVTLIGGIIFPSSVSQCQDFPKPESCNGDEDDNEECKKECVAQYERDAEECGVAHAFWGKRGYKDCMDRAGEYLRQCMRKCDGK